MTKGRTSGSEYDLPEIENRPDRRLSMIWIIPIIALILGITLVWKSYHERGPLIEIRLEAGRGVEADKTQIKHKDVVVGIVEEVTLSEALDAVLVKARMAKVVESYLGETTNFSVISAQIHGTNIRGLNTLLTGAYIEMDWSAKPQKKQRKFIGLTTPPLTPPNVKGTRITLVSENAGSIGVGSPILHRNIPVGRIESRKLSDKMNSVEYSAFIEAPYDKLIYSQSKFWNVSGLNIIAGPAGFRFEMASLNTLLSGGVVFGNVGTVLNPAPLADNQSFKIFSNQTAAFDSQYDAIEGEGYLFQAYFPSLAGLEKDSPVYWEGIRIGTVRDVIADVRFATHEKGLYAIFEIQPLRLGLDLPSESEMREGLREWISEGMRAQLTAPNILSPHKNIRMVRTDGSDGQTLDMDAKPYPAVPIIPADIAAITQNLDQIVANIAELPLDQLIGSAVRLLNHTDGLINDPNMKTLPTNLTQALGAFQGMADNIDQATKNLPLLINNINSMADTGETALSGLTPDSPLYVELAGAVRDLRETSRSLSALARRLELEPNSIIIGR